MFTELKSFVKKPVFWGVVVVVAVLAMAFGSKSKLLSSAAAKVAGATGA